MRDATAALVIFAVEARALAVGLLIGNKSGGHGKREIDMML